MALPGIFVTGTDTGVGKTLVAATLARLLHRRGIAVGVMKPVTSGCLTDNGRLVSEDAELLAWAAGYDSVGADMAPFLLKAPIAPAVAASREGVRIDFAAIRDAQQRLAESCRFLIVEGAGGLMVPLAGGLLVADLVTFLRLPLLVVARPGLGTINHTLLTCFAARQLDLDLRGVVLSDYPDVPGLAEEYAPHQIDSLSGAPLLGVLPHVSGSDQREVVEQLAERLDKDPAAKFLLREIGAA